MSRMVGEITDEFDVDEDEPYREQTSDGLIVDARTPVDDVNDQLNLSLTEDEDSVTIGGFITSHIGRIPETGEELEIDDVKYLVLDADERKINRLKIITMSVMESSNS